MRLCRLAQKQGMARLGCNGSRCIYKRSLMSNRPSAGEGCAKSHRSFGRLALAIFDTYLVMPKSCYLTGIQSQVDHVSKNIQNLHSIASGSAQEIYALVQSTDLKELPIAVGAEFGTYMDQHEEEYLHGTRTELLDDVQKWAVSPEGKCMFWLNGLAGTGKSTISRTIAKSFQQKQQGLLGASFFFKRGEGDHGNATRLFPTLMKQLLTKIPELRATIIQVIRGNPGISASQSRSSFMS
ncbi:hypothetical protein BDW67DRAFT_101372 [Aspergillus spinulosporus]